MTLQNLAATSNCWELIPFDRNIGTTAVNSPHDHTLTLGQFRYKSHNHNHNHMSSVGQTQIYVLTTYIRFGS